jgi:hypothetical protein
MKRLPQVWLRGLLAIILMTIGIQLLHR